MQMTADLVPAVVDLLHPDLSVEDRLGRIERMRRRVAAAAPDPRVPRVSS